MAAYEEKTFDESDSQDSAADRAAANAFEAMQQDEPIIGSPEWEARIDALIAAAGFPGRDTGNSNQDVDDQEGSDSSDVWHTPVPYSHGSWDNRPWGHYECVDAVASAMENQQSRLDATVLGQIIIDYFESDHRSWFAGQEPLASELASPLVQRVESALGQVELATIQEHVPHYATIIDEAARFAIRLAIDDQTTVVTALLQHYADHYNPKYRNIGSHLVYEIELSPWQPDPDDRASSQDPDESNLG